MALHAEASQQLTHLFPNHSVDVSPEGDAVEAEPDVVIDPNRGDGCTPTQLRFAPPPPHFYDLWEM